MTWFCHGLAARPVEPDFAPRDARRAKPACPMIEPIFPEPAEIPWEVER